MRPSVNEYDDGTTEREVLLGIFEQLRTIRAVVVVFTVVAVPLMLLGILEPLAD